MNLSNFSHSEEITPENVNLALYTFGSVKHLLALVDGTLSPISHIELKNRLIHLANTLEIVCLSSSLDDFDSPEWQVGREYDRRLISDIEVGLKSWDTL